MTQNRRRPATTRGEDFEWVNRWAEASGLNAARQFAGQPAQGTPPPAPARAASGARTGALSSVFPVLPDQLARDIAEIERARDAIIAAEGASVSSRPRPLRLLGILRRHDVVPVLTGAVVAFIVLIAYAAIVSIVELGR
jgi:hypothetical protein